VLSPPLLICCSPDGAIHAINLSANPDNGRGLKIYRELAQKQKIKLHPPKNVSTFLLDKVRKPETVETKASAFARIPNYIRKQGPISFN
jgi:hypothetical protein